VSGFGQTSRFATDAGESTILKILAIHNYYSQEGGENSVFRSQVNMLRKRGNLVGEYVRDSREIEDYKFSEKAAFFKTTFYASRTEEEIGEIVNREAPDVAHVHNVFPLVSPSVYIALEKAKIPIIQTLHNFRFLCPNGLFYTGGKVCELCKMGNTVHSIPRKCYRNSYTLSLLYATTIGCHRLAGTFEKIDHFIALSRFSAQKYLESGLFGAEKLSILGNFLPDPVQEPGSFTERENYLLYIGRLSSEKGVHVLLEALEGMPDTPVKVLGEGPQREELVRKAKQYQLNQVEFLGYLKGELKWDILRKAKATVIPSVCYENFPLTAVESMAVGTPVIASRLGGLSDLIDDNRTGYLFDPENPNDLRKCIDYIFMHPLASLNAGRAAREEFLDKYTEEKIGQQLESIYIQVINKKAQH
jgi:glycosyltransferase involved in cell wall biosynthesis